MKNVLDGFVGFDEDENYDYYKARSPGCWLKASKAKLIEYKIECYDENNEVLPTRFEKDKKNYFESEQII